MWKQKLIDFVIQFMEEIDKEISAMKIAVNARARLVAAEFMKRLSSRVSVSLLYIYRYVATSSCTRCGQGKVAIMIMMIMIIIITAITITDRSQLLWLLLILMWTEDRIKRRG